MGRICIREDGLCVLFHLSRRYIDVIVSFSCSVYLKIFHNLLCLILFLFCLQKVLTRQENVNTDWIFNDIKGFFFCNDEWYCGYG